MAIQIKEKLDLTDFLQANFPSVLKPIYKKRIFLINSFFGIVYLLIAGYIFFQSYLKHAKIETVHLSFLIFGFIFFFMAYYLAKREIRIYQKFINQMNDLDTIYTIDESQIKIENKQNKLSYRKNDIDHIQELPKWIIFHFKNGEKVTIYKPNMKISDQEFLDKEYKKFFTKN